MQGVHFLRSLLLSEDRGRGADLGIHLEHRRVTLEHLGLEHGLSLVLSHRVDVGTHSSLLDVDEGFVQLLFDLPIDQVLNLIAEWLFQTVHVERAHTRRTVCLAFLNIFDCLFNDRAR